MNGDALKLLRQYHGLKGVELGPLVDISPGYMSNLERQERDVPLTVIYAYAKHFKTSIEGILELGEALKSDDKMILGDAKLQRAYQWWLDVQEFKGPL